MCIPWLILWGWLCLDSFHTILHVCCLGVVVCSSMVLPAGHFIKSLLLLSFMRLSTISLELILGIGINSISPTCIFVWLCWVQSIFSHGHYWNQFHSKEPTFYCCDLMCALLTPSSCWFCEWRFVRVHLEGWCGVQCILWGWPGWNQIIKKNIVFFPQGALLYYC